MMKYKVIDICTGVDITNEYNWVITPSGELKYNSYGDLIGYPQAIYIIEGVYLLDEAIPDRREYYLGISDADAGYVDGWNDCLDEILAIGK